MKFKLLFSITIYLLSGFNIYAQDIHYPEKDKLQIEAFLDSLNTEEFGGTLIIKNLLNENHFDGKEIGIYRFFTLTSHSRSFILFFDGKKIEIKRNYNPEYILKDSFTFIDTHQSHLSEIDKANYYKTIIETVILNLNPPNMLPPPPKKNGG